MSIHLRTICTFLSLAALAAFTACADTSGNDDVLTPYDAGHDADTTADADSDDAGTDTDGQDFDTRQEGDTDTGPGDDPDANGDADVNGGNDDFCQPVGDGIIRRDRYPVEQGDSAPFLFSLDIPVATAGEEIDGTLTWDLSQERDDDFTEEVVLHDPEEFWFGDEYPGADWASELSRGDDDEYGLFDLTDDALRMIGVASPDDGYSRTELEHDPPVTILSFPLEVDDSWETEARVRGSYGGNHVHGHDETYVSEVDARGELITPYGTFDVLRVNTWLEQEVWIPGTMIWLTEEIRTYTFVAECFGTVARITSPADEAEEEFDHAAEVMRLTL